MTYDGKLRQHYTKMYQHKGQLSKTQKHINQSKAAREDSKFIKKEMGGRIVKKER